MKFTKLIILTVSFLLLFSLSSAVKKDHFLNIDSNIKNEELRAELEILMTDFDAERQRIHDYYAREIEKLKEERRSDIKTIKKEYSEKRKILNKKYGEERKLIQSTPDKKIRKEKKPLQKTK